MMINERLMLTARWSGEKVSRLEAWLYNRTKAGQSADAGRKNRCLLSGVLQRGDTGVRLNFDIKSKENSDLWPDT